MRVLKKVCTDDIGISGMNRASLRPNRTVSFYASPASWRPRVGNKYAIQDAFLANLTEVSID